MLNGSQGSFCLDAGHPKTDALAARQWAWSSDLGHYVRVAGDNVVVFRWDQREAEETRLKEVLRRLDEFHQSLERNQPRRESSVVAYVTRLFRGLRNSLPRGLSGDQSLQAFLTLLACAHDKVERLDLDIVRWALEPSAIEASLKVPSPEWDAIREALTEERSGTELRPALELTLRHVSGALFQEAHYEVTSGGAYQLSLLPSIPDQAQVRRVHTVGAIFTPPTLVRTIVEEALRLLGTSRSTISILDPACGSGEFLREALRQLQLLNYTGRVKLFGIDLSPAACAMARFILAFEARNWRREAVDVEIKNADALEVTWPSTNLVLMNPPFVSWENLTSIWKSRLRDLLGSSLSYRPDLSMAFVLLAMKSLPPQGILATLLPASLLRSKTAEPWRALLTESLSPYLIARLGNQWLFPGVTVDAGLYVASRNKGQVQPLALLWADHRVSSASAALRALRRLRTETGVADEEGEGFSVFIDKHPSLTPVRWEPRPISSIRLLNRVSALPKVADLFHVRQGVRTGNNDVFIIDPPYFEQLNRSEKRFFRPAVINSSIREGRLSLDAYIFFPYGKHLPSIDTEISLKAAVPKYYRDILEPNKRVLTKNQRDRWWLLNRHRIWQEPVSSKIVSTYFGKAGSFAWDSGGNYVVVQGFAWLPKTEEFRQKLTPRVALAYLAILNSDVLNRLLGAVSVHIGGGQFDLSPRYVNSLPLPDLTSSDYDREVLDCLSEMGEALSTRRSLAEKDHASIVDRLYGHINSPQSAV